MRKIAIIFSFILLATTYSVVAQNIGTTTFNKRPQKKKKPRPITEEFSMGMRLNSDGWSIMAERAFINNYTKRTGFIWMDFSEKKHSKEDKQLNETFAAVFPEQPAPLPYKYGKINNFYQFKVGYGQKRALTGKLDKKNVVVHWTYAAGISIGFLKPYYLEVLVPVANSVDEFTREFISYNDPETRDYFLNEYEPFPLTIIGGSIFTKGIGEIRVKPGLAARTGFYFDYTPREKNFLGVEIGTSVEMYPNPVPIMVNTDNPSIFVNLYLDVRFGKRWSKEN